MGNCDFCPPSSQAQNENNTNEAIVFNEYPFRIEGDKLKHKVHRSIGALTFLNKNKKINIGSATLISNNLILTCAHNLYDKIRDSENSDFKFYIGADGVTENFYKVESWRLPSQYKAKKQNKLQFDYALMKLKTPIFFDQYLSLSQSCRECVLRDNQNKKVMIYGFLSFQQNFVALNEEGNIIKLYQYGLTRKNRILDVDHLTFTMKYNISRIVWQIFIQSNSYLKLKKNHKLIFIQNYLYLS